MMKENLIKIYERSFIDNWELPALTDYNTGERLTYGDFARNIAKLHMLFENSGVKQGDRIALIGKNIPNWVTVFMGTITYGAVIVPILQEFNPADAQHIINFLGFVATDHETLDGGIDYIKVQPVAGKSTEGFYFDISRMMQIAALKFPDI